jgi:hypothetical protein
MDPVNWLAAGKEKSVGWRKKVRLPLGLRVT